MIYLYMGITYIYRDVCSMYIYLFFMYIDFVHKCIYCTYIYNYYYNGMM